MLTTDNFLFILYADDNEFRQIVDEYFYDRYMALIVNVSDDVNYSPDYIELFCTDKIAITPSSNVKHSIYSDGHVKFIRYQDLIKISYGVQQAILRNLRRYSKIWGLA